MLDFLELEETVGRAWHRMVGSDGELSAFTPIRRSSLAEVQGQIAVMFRALGGEAGVQIASSNARKSGHRLGWRQRIGLGDERLDHPGRDAATVFLPDRIAIFPDRDLNASLYRWLAAWFAAAPVATIAETDPLRRDLLMLRRSRDTVDAILSRFPGLAQALREARRRHREARPRRPLPRTEREVEQIVLALLDAGRPPEGTGCGRP